MSESAIIFQSKEIIWFVTVSITLSFENYCWIFGFTFTAIQAIRDKTKSACVMQVTCGDWLRKMNDIYNRRTNILFIRKELFIKFIAELMQLVEEYEGHPRY